MTYPTTPASAQVAVDTGLYSVPRPSISEGTPHSVLSTNGSLFYMSGNPFDIYDVPRPISISPDQDEEGIYDDPLDIWDMEIYDYPPDVANLGLEEPPPPPPHAGDSARNSTISLISEVPSSDRGSSTMSEDSWQSFSLPIVPSSARPLATMSMASSEEYFQVRVLHTSCTTIIEFHKST